MLVTGAVPALTKAPTSRGSLMRRLVLLIVVILAPACGDSGPESNGFEKGLWQLTSVNGQSLPAPGNATGGEIWAAAFLQFSGATGNFERCMESPSTSERFSRPTALVVHPISDDKAELSYFDRRTPVPDTAALSGAKRTLRFRNVVLDQVEGVDVLSFVPLAGAPPGVCTLAP